VEKNKKLFQANQRMRIMNQSYFIGIDIGTQGARVVMVDDKGRQLGAKEEVFPISNQSREEQDPLLWWSSCKRSLKFLCRELVKEIDLSLVKAIGVTSTSGTIIPVDKSNIPLHPALMYSDGRSKDEAAYCEATAVASGIKGYTAFNASSGLPKMLWFLANYPHKTEAIGRFIHAADFITGQLSGNFEVTDYTNALKSGYDLQTFSWPSYITDRLPLRPQWLQKVVPSGAAIGKLDEWLAHELGLSPDVIITAGITDGCASQVASGAVNLGDWNTTIGTTLVVKGVTEKEIIDPSGALYCHRHPEGYWMPGGASNTGADWVSRLFGDADIAALGEAAAGLIPGSHLAWPLMQQGERFPFVAPQAKGFAPAGLSQEELFTANMEGVAYIERYAYERIKFLSGEKIARIFSAGGGSNSDIWLMIRSSVVGVPVCKMQNVSGAAGAAVIAASKTHFNSLIAAAQAMIIPEKKIEPDKKMMEQYELNYQRFITLLQQKTYLE
jgi:sugar (pentulose or hexulose) kinase